MASEMTTAEVRDKVAGLDGWTTYKASNGLTVWEFGSIDDGTYTTATDHPITDTLDACAAAWDRHAGSDGWTWGRVEDPIGWTWSADCRGKVCMVEAAGHDAASELRDRWALLGEVLKARGV